jgi:1-acyl-sn-glycerol-3-phosphate acyltransferase
MQKLWYSFVKFWVKLAIKLFYRRIEIQGYDTYPKNGPVLLAPNHQNAFMDALIPAVFAPRPIHFLVRADVFKSPLARKFFHSLNMMPVYRKRDGVANLSKNDDVFDQCAAILRANGTVLIFPEAGHLGGRKLRTLSKGFARIAFGACKDSEGLDINIVPVGLNYGDYYESQSRLMINFGVPIPISNYLDAFDENQAKAMGHLRNDLQKRLSDEIIHVENDDALHAMDIELERILPFYIHRQSGFTQASTQLHFYKNRADKLNTIKADSPYFKRIEIYDTEMKRRKLRAPFFYINERDGLYWFTQFLLLTVLLPLFLASWIFHLPTYLVINGILKKFVADRQFYSSIKLVGTIFLAPIFTLIYILIAIFVCPSPLKAVLAILAFFPLSIVIIRALRLSYRYLFTKLRMVFLKMKNKPLVKYLKEIEGDIINMF